MSKQVISDNNYCIILAGGIGSRLWPFSSNEQPKQFLDLLGTGETMLQMTYKRFTKFLPKENVFVSTYADYTDLVRSQLPEMPPSRLVAEPVQLNTAPAIALTVAYIAAECEKANIIISPADQMVLNNDMFCEQVSSGFDFVGKKQSFLVLGVKATSPATCYGYLQAGEELENGFSVVKSFTEKPNIDFARFFVESGEFYWSTGLFMCNTKTLFKALETDYPDISAVVDMLRKGQDQRAVLSYIRDHYPRTPFQSIDMLILEHNKNVYIEPCAFGWQDVGSWQDFYRISSKDNEGNMVAGANAVFYDSEDNIVATPNGKKVMLQDLHGYLVAEKDDLLIICKKDDTAQLRRMMTDADVKFGKSLS